MSDDLELVKRLRTVYFGAKPHNNERSDAADAIERLTGEVAALKAQRDCDFQKYMKAWDRALGAEGEAELTHRHACRLLDAIAPGLEKLPRVVGVIDQIDNATVWLKERAEAAEAEAARLRECLMRIKKHPHGGALVFVGDDGELRSLSNLIGAALRGEEG